MASAASAWLGLHRFADRILSLGYDPDAEAEWWSIVPASPLSHAARNYQVKTVQTLLKHNANANYKHKLGRTPIHQVAAQGHAEIAKILVEEGRVDVESTDDEGLTTLYFACLWGQHHVAEVLLSLGADPDMGIKADEDRRDWSPLVVAADDGYERCVQLLLEHNADPNLPGPTENGGALRYAAVNGHLGVCKLLLEQRANPNSPSINPPILTQVLQWFQGTKNQEEIFELLLSHGADPNAKDDEGEPLLLAAVNGCMGLFVQKLLDHGADVEITNPANNTALSYAASKQQEEIVDMLLAKNANPNVPDKTGYTALYYAVPSDNIVKKLLEKGADPNAFRGDFTCLMYAAWTNQRQTIQLLLEHNASLEDAGANLKHVVASTGTPLIHYAVAESSLAAILGFPSKIDLEARDNNGYTAAHMGSITLANLRLLINAGADLDVQDTVRKDTPLTLAASNGNFERVELLVRRGAKIDLGSPVDGTALTQACFMGHFDVVKYLVEKGADVNASCNGINGAPLHSVCCQTSDNVDPDTRAAMIDYLIEHGASVSGEAGLFGYAINAASIIATPRLLGQLLDKGASVDVRDDFDRSPVHFAALNGAGNFKVVLDAGGDVKARDATGRLPIHWAAQAGRIQVLQAIDSVVPIKEMVNDTDLDGWTPLCWAARGTDCWCPAEFSSEEADQIQVIRFLLENGADRAVTGTVGSKVWTPLKIARFHGQSPEVLNLLRYGLEPPPNNENGEEIPAERQEDKSRTGTHHDLLCDVCQAGVRGYQHRCTTRVGFDLCFKCVERAKDLRPLEHDSFEEKGAEFEAGDDEEEKKSESTDSDTDSDTDSGSDTDSDSDSGSDSG
ncbi:Ankyrin-3 [Escovopsis weberi]|uniref:Ankyrin-3 n=1 Tax=Escovopsis weberi TaxID=150374 RepID=A0A0M9VXF2_ESCWE|nr:Ankyrin-3 [Escovopsis weberi]